MELEPMSYPQKSFGAHPKVNLVEKIEAFKKSDRFKGSCQLTSNVMAQLPGWPERVRAVPNAFLRSALFCAIGKGRRRYINGEELATPNGLTIRFKGEQLDQDDLEVWENVLHAVRHQKLGSKCRLTSYSLLKLIDKTDTGKNRAILQNRIERLVATALTVKQGRYSYIGSLIVRAARDEETREWTIEMDDKLCALFAADQFTHVEWGVRRSLRGHQLGQWLHGFYASHSKPFPLKIETLHKLCGSEATLMSDFVKTLRKSLKAVAKAHAGFGARFDFEIRGGLVHVEKKSGKGRG